MELWSRLLLLLTEMLRSQVKSQAWIISKNGLKNNLIIESQSNLKNRPFSTSLSLTDAFLTGFKVDYFYKMKKLANFWREENRPFSTSLSLTDAFLTGFKVDYFYKMKKLANFWREENRVKKANYKIFQDILTCNNHILRMKERDYCCCFPLPCTQSRALLPQVSCALL